MKTINLLPHRFKKFGWMLFLPGLVLGIIYLASDYFEPSFLDTTAPAIINDSLDGIAFFEWVENNLIDELISVLLITGGCIIVFSREAEEDEFIARIRLESLLWATFVNYAILALVVVSVYGVAFFTVMSINMFTVLLFFIIRFHWVLYKSKQALQHEESY